jgi:hypothetical protein
MMWVAQFALSCIACAGIGLGAGIIVDAVCTWFNISRRISEVDMFAWKVCPFSPGDRVRDPIFGEGEVRRVRSDGKVMVRFDGDPREDLCMRPRDLEPVKVAS